MMRNLVTLSCLLLVAGAQASLLDIVNSVTSKVIDGARDLIKLELSFTNAQKLALGYDDDTVLNFTQLATKYGYEAEEFTVTSEDGYILTLFHLWASNCTSRGTPVLWMHGVMMTADGLIASGPGRALGYLLADNCYDVWAGNNRGNTYSRAHTTLDPDVDADFWQHSPDEMAIYDLPATIDAVLELTGYSTLNYIGFSQGAGIMMMMCANQPDQCSKVSLIINMSTATRMINTRSTAAALLFTTYNSLQDTFATFNLYETQFHGSVLQTLLEFSCQQQGNIDILYSLCQNFIYILDSENPGSVLDETFPVVYSGFPGGVSVRTMVRYAQAASNSRLYMYDHGSEALNQEAYGSTTPPEYDLSLVTSPIVFFVGAGDYVMDPRDTLWAASQVQNLLEVHYVEDSNWNHFNYIYSHTVPTYILPKTLEYLAQYTTYN